MNYKRKLNMKKIICSIFTVTFFSVGFAQLGPEVTSWIINTNGSTGYNNIPSNVQQVQYSTPYVYVSATCIPGYDIGPWAGNPNIPANQNFVFKITRTPVENTGTLTATPNGHIGVWTNGVSIFNAKDAFSYNNQGVWNQDAIPNEGASFDDCLGHPAPNGEYHHHLNPTCLYDDVDNSFHSPIIGYAFDGFPIYGTFAYANTNGTGAIVQMKSSYRLRNITVRNTYYDGSSVTPGPDVSASYPLGKYIEDYEYVAGLGDLDEHNGRFCITPEYPAGIYAYFVTIDSIGDPVYPYVLGPQYYGIVTAGNTGPGSGHNVPGETVTTYTPPTSLENEFPIKTDILYPNPATDRVNVQSSTGIENLRIYNATGIEVMIINAGSQEIDLSALENGVYIVKWVNNGAWYYQKLIKQ